MRGRSAARLVGVAIVLGLAVAGAAGGAGSAPAKPKVVLVLTSAWQASPFERSARDGLSRAVRELGVEGRIVVLGPKEQLLPVLLAVARQRPDLIVSLVSWEPRALDTAALRFPDTRFLALDMPREMLEHGPRNVQGTLFRVEEPSYLAGYLAGLMEKRRPGKDVVSTVGGARLPQVDRFIAGFQAGARKADPGVTTLNAYSNDLLDAAKCRRVALDQIARGSGVVFQVASVCGLGALAAARHHGVLGVGVDSDQSGLGPHILTSVVKRLDVAVYAAARSLVNGKFTTGADSVFTLRNGGVGLGKISQRVPRALVSRIDAIRRQIVAGKLGRIPTTIE